MLAEIACIGHRLNLDGLLAVKIGASNSTLNERGVKLDLEAIAQQVGGQLMAEAAMLATAESCTGGWVAQTVTALAGSSSWFDAGFVTYSNRAKERMLGVQAQTLIEHGAVSEAVVLQMAKGACANSSASYSVAISGVAGPGGGSDDKPVGTVWIAWMTPEKTATKKFLFDGDRKSVRKQAVAEALQGLLKTN